MNRRSRRHCQAGGDRAWVWFDNLRRRHGKDHVLTFCRFHADNHYAHRLGILDRNGREPFSMARLQEPTKGAHNVCEVDECHATKEEGYLLCSAHVDRASPFTIAPSPSEGA